MRFDLGRIFTEFLVHTSRCLIKKLNRMIAMLVTPKALRHEVRKVAGPSNPGGESTTSLNPDFLVSVGWVWDPHKILPKVSETF